MTHTPRTASTRDPRSTVMTNKIADRTSTSMPRVAGQAAVAILVCVFGFHAYWGAGGEWGAATAFGSPDIPPPAASAVVAILIAGATLLVLARIGVLAAPLPRRMLRVGTWMLVVAFALAGVNNLIQPQDAYARDWHIYLFGPLLLTLAALCAIAERSKPAR
jgi:hypothetical protein